MDYVEQFQRDTSHVSGVNEDVVALVLADMRARYSTPPPSNVVHGHLTAAYQTCLDACVHLMNEMAVHGVGPTTELTESAYSDQRQRWYLHDVQCLFSSHVRTAISLRAIIEEREHRGVTPVQEHAS